MSKNVQKCPKTRKIFVGKLVETMTPKGHFEINWPLEMKLLLVLYCRCIDYLRWSYFFDRKRSDQKFKILLFNQILSSAIEKYVGKVLTVASNDCTNFLIKWIKKKNYVLNQYFVHDVHLNSGRNESVETLLYSWSWVKH